MSLVAVHLSFISFLLSLFRSQSSRVRAVVRRLSDEGLVELFLPGILQFFDCGYRVAAGSNPELLKSCSHV
uniref:Putative secreted protein n=1 Tax=Amblyomma triste TaxID=251400 RepID=A0A023G367_AMBTT